jgi:hypothetical protein
MTKPGAKQRLDEPIRTTIVLEHGQHDYVIRLATRDNISFSAALRQVIDDHIIIRALPRLEARGIDNG